MSDMVKYRAAIWSILKLTALYFTMSDIVHVKKKSRVLEKPGFCQFAKNSLLENDGCLVDF